MRRRFANLKHVDSSLFASDTPPAIFRSVLGQLPTFSIEFSYITSSGKLDLNALRVAVYATKNAPPKICQVLAAPEDTGVQL